MNIRETNEQDVAECGRIMYDAFAGISDKHNFPHDFPSQEVAIGFAEMVIGHPQIYGVAAEIDGKFVGSNFLWEFDDIAAVGPITVDPGVQAGGVGRKLMEAVIERGKDARGIRLCQAAYNSASMSLYTTLGFDLVEPLVIMEGAPKGSVSEGTVVRRMEESDLDACGDLHERTHGVSRRNELGFVSSFSPSVVAERDGRITGYMAAPGSWQLNHAVGETVEDLTDLIVGAAEYTDGKVSLLMPTRQSELFRAGLRSGMRVVMPLSLMVIGDYREPSLPYIPSVLY